MNSGRENFKFTVKVHLDLDLGRGLQSSNFRKDTDQLHRCEGETINMQPKYSGLLQQRTWTAVTRTGTGEGVPQWVTSVYSFSRKPEHSSELTSNKVKTFFTQCKIRL